MHPYRNTFFTLCLLVNTEEYMVAIKVKPFFSNYILHCILEKTECILFQPMKPTVLCNNKINTDYE